MEQFKTLKDHVYSYIAQQIRTGALTAEERINESQICEKLKISRTPVREALIQLTAEGVLENMARKGFVIKTISAHDIVELYEIIGVLDGKAAMKACDLLTDQDLADLQFYTDAMDLAIKAGNFEMYHNQQENFHQLYIEKCGNQSLINEIARLESKLLKRAAADDNEEEMKAILLETNAEHREILALFQKRDATGLFRYISEVHWTANYAEYDAKSSIATAEEYKEKK